jgi:hypothetical protein
MHLLDEIDYVARFAVSETVPILKAGVYTEARRLLAVEWAAPEALLILARLRRWPQLVSDNAGYVDMLLDMLTSSLDVR